ncbi:hypothetical protein [Streptomyces sp. KL118A]|uniref:hypothetical protein n=2 Tax=Streptomyces TaxID=1883 RepID=UPI00278BB13B|nr:hypothetical protein [Streptomyces sp. KL118A]
MMIVLLYIVMALLAAGLAAVVWASRGGPRWVQGVAKATLVSAELVTSAVKKSSRSGYKSGNYSGDTGDSGSSGSS